MNGKLAINRTALAWKTTLAVHRYFHLGFAYPGFYSFEVSL